MSSLAIRDSFPLDEGLSVPPTSSTSSLAKRSSGTPKNLSVAADDSENGGLDYDVPRGKVQKGNPTNMDYDIPRTKRDREATPSSPSKKSSGTEAVAQLKKSPRNSSDESRPPSMASSISSLSYSSHGSSSNVAQVITVTKEGGGMVDYDIPKPSQHILDTQLTLEQELDELEQQLIMADNQKKKEAVQVQQQQKGGEGLAVQPPATLLLKHGLGSNHSINGDDELSSHGSSDNLGVWDDVNYEEEEGEEMVGQKEEVILDSWIKELESASKGMEALAKVGVLSVDKRVMVAMVGVLSVDQRVMVTKVGVFVY